MGIFCVQTIIMNYLCLCSLCVLFPLNCLCQFVQSLKTHTHSAIRHFLYCQMASLHFSIVAFANSVPGNVEMDNWPY